MTYPGPKDQKSMNNIPIFKPNNHSKWQISWNPVSNLTLEETHNVLLIGYGISNITEVRQIDEWEKMSNNFKIVLGTENGSKKFLLRKNISIKSAESLELMENLSAFLRDQAGVPTPQILKTGNGSLFFYHQEFFYQLFEFIEGSHFRGLEEELTDFAGNLARIHTALAHFPFIEEIKSRGGVKVINPWNIDGWGKIFSYSQRGSTEIDLAVASTQDIILKTATCVRAKPPKNTRKQVIKGDQHPLNTLYENGRLVALLDFADAEFGELIKDIGNACHRFVRQFVVFQGGDWQKTLPRGLDIFFSHYQSINPLTEEEKALIPLAILDGLLQKTYSRLYKYYMTSESEIYNDIAELKKQLELLQEAELVNNYISRTI